MHEIICHHCRRAHRLSDEKLAKFAGKPAQCTCGHTFMIEPPAPAPAASPSDAEMFDAIMSAPPAPQATDESSAAPSDNIEYSAPSPAVEVSYASPAPQPSRGYHRPTSRAPGGFRDFLEFRRMITVGIVSWVFVLGTIAWLLVALYGLYSTLTAAGPPADKLWPLTQLVLGAFVGVAVLRLLCEFAVVVFRINETLTEIKNQRFE